MDQLVLGHRNELAGLVYEDTAARPDRRQLVGGVPALGRHRGYLFAFRQAGGPATQTIALQGLDPTTRYTVTDVRTGAALGTLTGAGLEAGLTVSLPTPFSAVVLSITPAGGAAA